MKLIDTIKESGTKLLLSAIFGVLGILIGSLYSDVIPIVLPIVIQELPKTVLLKMLSVAILLFSLSILASLFIYFQYKPKLITKFGVLWDKNKEAYCPSCQTPLSEGTHFNSAADNYYYFKCFKCKIPIRLKHNGKNILLDEAQKLLKS
jgi:hypothetical protein